MANISRKQYKLKDKKIKIYALTEGEDDMGQSIQTLGLVGEVWAYYRQIGGSEYYDVKKIDAKEDSVFCINYREDITAHNFIIFNDKVYEVTRTDDYEGYKTDLFIYATWRKELTEDTLDEAQILD